MNIPAVIIAVAVALALIAINRKTDRSYRFMGYPALMMALPACYWVIALASSDYDALMLELGAGVLFIVLATLCVHYQHKGHSILLGTGWLLHGLYDAVLGSLFINAGTPIWWPEFCGTVDVLVGGYLISRAFQFFSPEMNPAL